MTRRLVATVCLTAMAWGLLSVALSTPVMAKGRLGRIASAAGGLIKSGSSRSGITSGLVNKARNLGSGKGVVGTIGNALKGDGKVGNLLNGNVASRVKDAVKDVRGLGQLPGNVQNLGDRARNAVKVAENIAGRPLGQAILDPNGVKLSDIGKRASDLVNRLDGNGNKLPLQNAVQNLTQNRPVLGNLSNVLKPGTLNNVVQNATNNHPALGNLANILKPGALANVVNNAANNVVPQPVPQPQGLTAGQIVQIVGSAAPALAALRRPAMVGGGNGGGGFVAQQPAPAAVQPAPAIAASPTADVEMVSVRLMDLGDEVGQGPKFRLMFKNNGASPMTTAMKVVLIASKDTEITAESPFTVAELTKLDAGQISTTDVRLPREVLAMSQDSAGQPAPFATLVAVLDAGNTLEESNETNNVLSVNTPDLQLVDITVQSADKATAPTGTNVTLRGEGLGNQPGKAVVEVGGMKLAARVVNWTNETATVELPGMVLAAPVHAKLNLERADGQKSPSLTIAITPTT